MITIEPGLPMAEVEKRHILATLRHLQYNKTATAKALGLSLKTVYTRLHAYRAAGYEVPFPGRP